MTSIFRRFLFALLGFIVTVFGVAHAVGNYPSPDVIRRFTDALPTLRAIVSFSLGVLAIVAGVVLLIPFLIRMVRKPAYRSSLASLSNPFGDGTRPGSYSRPAHQDDQFNPHQDDSGDLDYTERPGSDYPSRYGGHPSNNGRFDDHRWAGTYR